MLDLISAFERMDEEKRIRSAYLLGNLPDKDPETESDQGTPLPLNGAGLIRHAIRNLGATND